MAEFRNVDATDFLEWSAGEVRAFSRALSSSGMAADARAIGKAGEKLADSIAELERDTAAVNERWQGESKDRSYEVLGRYTGRSYQAGVAVIQLVGNVQSLSNTASSTKSRFGELPDPPSGMSSAWSGFDHRAAVAEALAGTYTSPVKSSASTMPLSEGGIMIGFAEYGPAFVRRDQNGTVGAPDAETGPGQQGGSGGENTGAGGGSGAGSAADTDTDVDTGAGPEAGAGNGDDPSAARGGSAVNGAGGGSTGAGGGGSPGTGAGGAPSDSGNGAGLETAGDGYPAAEDEPPVAGGEPSNSLLTPAAAVPFAPTSRTPGIGTAGVGASGLSRSASPLGLRQDAAALRSSSTTVGSGAVPSTGARPSSGPYGMPPAGAGGQRGQGDGRHRVPAYLIDKANGEEIIGGMPLVGPGVIGQWRSDGTPDPRPGRPAPQPDGPRDPDPPVRGGSRSR